MTASAYSDTIAANIRATRARKKLDQAVVVERMRYLGYLNWHRQTLGKVERGERTVTAAEIIGLALAMETNVPILLASNGEDTIKLGDGGISGRDLASLVSGRNNGAVRWGDDNKPVFSPGENWWFGEREDDPARDRV